MCSNRALKGLGEPWNFAFLRINSSHIISTSAHCTDTSVKLIPGQRHRDPFKHFKKIFFFLVYLKGREAETER